MYVFLSNLAHIGLIINMEIKIVVVSCYVKGFTYQVQIIFEGFSIPNTSCMGLVLQIAVH